MNIALYTWNKPYKTNILAAMAAGARRSGHECQLRGTFTEVEEDADAAVFIGCNQVVKEAYDAYLAAGKHTIYIDKGYLRYAEQGVVDPREYYRVAVDCFQPSDYVMDLGVDASRWERERINPRPWRTEGDLILYADVSRKYKDWFDLTDKDVEDDLQNLKNASLKSVVYRSRNDETKIYEALTKAWALATLGSNAAVDAILYGVPVIVTGVDCIALPIAGEKLFYDDGLYIPSDEERYRWLCGLAWCQFTLTEFETGFAWKKLNERLEK